jgi:hypothetical protein
VIGSASSTAGAGGPGPCACGDRSGRRSTWRGLAPAFVLFVLASFSALGCPGKKAAEKAAATPQPAQNAPSAPIAPHAPGTPLELNRPDEARVRLDLTAARDAIRKQHEINGTYPASLSELDIKLSFPDDLTYDVRTGEVRSRSYPAF